MAVRVKFDKVESAENSAPKLAALLGQQINRARKLAELAKKHGIDFYSTDKATRESLTEKGVSQTELGLWTSIFAWVWFGEPGKDRQ